MCEYCNGSEETQQPLEDNGIGIFTIIAKEKQLSCVFVSTRPMEALAEINYCPMCGEKLKGEVDV